MAEGGLDLLGKIKKLLCSLTSSNEDRISTKRKMESIHQMEADGLYSKHRRLDRKYPYLDKLFTEQERKSDLQTCSTSAGHPYADLEFSDTEENDCNVRISRTDARNVGSQNSKHSTSAFGESVNRLRPQSLMSIRAEGFVAGTTKISKFLPNTMAQRQILSENRSQAIKNSLNRLQQRHQLQMQGSTRLSHISNGSLPQNKNASRILISSIQQRNKYEELLENVFPIIPVPCDRYVNKIRRKGFSNFPKFQPTIDLLSSSDSDEDTTVKNSKLVNKKRELPYVEPINTQKEQFESNPIVRNDWLASLKKLYEKRRLERDKLTVRLQKSQEYHAVEKAKEVRAIERRFRSYRLNADFVLDEQPELEANEVNFKSNEAILLEKKEVEVDLKLIEAVLLEKEVEEEFPRLTSEMYQTLNRAVSGGPNTETLVSKFNVDVKRHDVATLQCGNWLNDEIINFYLNLIAERSKTSQKQGLPRVYTMNTFFVPRFLSGGYSVVKRWTRKVDIFSYDIILVPVHHRQVHWCMAIIDLRNKTIRYYDSMGQPNDRLLSALEEYLKQESNDKRMRIFQTNDFIIENVKDCPRQMNGSDCGVFACMFGEYASRNKEMTFSQEHMPYFREKMMYEIVMGKLMN